MTRPETPSPTEEKLGDEVLYLYWRRRERGNSSRAWYSPHWKGEPADSMNTKLTKAVKMWPSSFCCRCLQLEVSFTSNRPEILSTGGHSCKRPLKIQSNNVVLNMVETISR